MVLRFEPAREGIATHPGNPQQIVSHFIARTLASVERSVREPGIPAETIAESQLGCNAPGILSKVEHSPLPVLRVGDRFSKSLEVVRQTQQEAGRSESRPGHSSVASNRLIEKDPPRAAVVAGNTDVLTPTEVRSPFDVMVTSELRPVIYPLEDVLGLEQRTVALIIVQAKAFAETAVAENFQFRKARGVFPAGKVKVWEACVFSSGDAEVEGQDLHPISNGSKAEIGEQGGAQGVVEPGNPIQVPRVGFAGESQTGQGWSASLAKGRRRDLQEACVMGADEVVQLLGHVMINLDVETIAVKLFRPAGRKDRIGRRARCQYGRREEVQQVCSLRRNAIQGNDVQAPWVGGGGAGGISELRSARAIGSAGRRIIDRDPEGAEIALAFCGGRNSGQYRGADTAPPDLVVAEAKELILDKRPSD